MTEPRPNSVTVTKGRSEGILDIESALHTREDTLCGVLIVHWDPQSKRIAIDDIGLFSDMPQERRDQYLAFWRAISERAEDALRRWPGKL